MASCASWIRGIWSILICGQKRKKAPGVKKTAYGGGRTTGKPKRVTLAERAAEYERQRSPAYDIEESPTHSSAGYFEAHPSATEDSSNPKVNKKHRDNLGVADFSMTQDDGETLNKESETCSCLWSTRPDMAVVIGNQTFYGHEHILRANSTYFAERFGFMNNSQSVCQVKSPCVTPEAFNIILLSMYKGEVAIPCQMLVQVYRAASFLGVKDTVKKCLDMIQITTWDIRKIIRLYITAHNLDNTAHKVQLLQMMAQNFEEVVTQKEFMELTKSQLVDLLMVDKIAARSETTLFLAALKWLNEDFLQREEHAADVLKCVRFAAMSMEEVIKCFHPPILPGLMVKQDILTMLREAVCYISAKSVEKGHLFKELASKPRYLTLKEMPIQLWEVTTNLKDFRLDCAATKIQAAFRGHLARKRL